MIDIKIEGVETKMVQFGTLYTIVDGKKKYTFFDKKKDGGKTKAYDQFSLYGFTIGDVVKAEVKEDKVPIPSDPGKHFIRRKILYFATVEGAPDFDRPKTAPVVPTINIDSEITEDQLPF